MTSTRLLTVAEAARIQRVAEKTVLAWIERGDLVAVRNRTGEILIPRDAFDAFRRRRELSIPEPLLRAGTIAEALQSFEAHFGMSTGELLDIEAVGRRLDLSGPQDEMMYAYWKSLIRLAQRNGSLAKPA